MRKMMITKHAITDFHRTGRKECSETVKTYSALLFPREPDAF